MSESCAQCGLEIATRTLVMGRKPRRIHATCWQAAVASKVMPPGPPPNPRCSVCEKHPIDCRCPKKTEQRMSDAQPYTREEFNPALDRLVDVAYRLGRGSGQPYTSGDLPQLRSELKTLKDRLLATAKQGVEVIAAANEAIRALDEYADEVRGDWSDFDGRANRRELHAIVADLRGLLRGKASPQPPAAPSSRPQCERDPICQCEPGHEGACWPERYQPAAAVERGVRETTDEPTDEDVDHAVAAMRHDFGAEAMVSEEDAIRVALRADRQRRTARSGRRPSSEEIE